MHDTAAAMGAAFFVAMWAKIERARTLMLALAM